MPPIWIVIIAAAFVLGLLIVFKVLKTGVQIIISIVIFLLATVILLRMFG